MIDRSESFRLPELGVVRRAPAPMAVLVLGSFSLIFCLGGCASVGDSFASSAFLDPAKYDQFDCKQLEAERKTLASRAAELQGLIDKADTGVGGSVVGEMVYRNDYISARASAKLAEENWRSSKCIETPAVVATPPVAPATAPVSSARGARKRSGGAG